MHTSRCPCFHLVPNVATLFMPTLLVPAVLKIGLIHLNKNQGSLGTTIALRILLTCILIPSPHKLRDFPQSGHVLVPNMEYFTIQKSSNSYIGNNSAIHANKYPPPILPLPVLNLQFRHESPAVPTQFLPNQPQPCPFPPPPRPKSDLLHLLATNGYNPPTQYDYINSIHRP